MNDTSQTWGCQHLGAPTARVAELPCCGGKLTMFSCALHTLAVPFAYGRTARHLRQCGIVTCDACPDYTAGTTAPANIEPVSLPR